MRRKPSREAVDAAAGLYQLMLEEERRAGPKDACAASLALLVGLLQQKETDYESFIHTL